MRAPALPTNAPVILKSVMGRGRFLLDMRPFWGPYGWVYVWTIEDMDLDADDQVVATGRVLHCANPSVVMNHEISTALLGPEGLVRTPVGAAP